MEQGKRKEKSTITSVIDDTTNHNRPCSVHNTTHHQHHNCNTLAILSMDSLVSMNAKQMKVGEGEKDKEING